MGAPCCVGGAKGGDGAHRDAVGYAETLLPGGFAGQRTGLLVGSPTVVQGGSCSSAAP